MRSRGSREGGGGRGIVWQKAETSQSLKQEDLFICLAFTPPPPLHVRSLIGRGGEKLQKESGVGGGRGVIALPADQISRGRSERSTLSEGRKEYVGETKR